MVKTFVTTGLQDAIGHHFGYEVVNVLTGFKYIAQKLGKYEQAIPAEKREGYRKMSEEQTRALRLEYSRYFVFGGEESYGYLAGQGRELRRHHLCGTGRVCGKHRQEPSGTAA